MNYDNTLLEVLGMNVVEVSKEKVVVTMPVNEKTRQPYGLLHGGASVALAETVASIGANYAVAESNEVCVGLEINANHIKAKKDGIVTGVGTLLHRGKTTQVWNIRIEDEQQQLICISRCTMAVLKKDDS
ncbi:hotdog fold thioesterase [Bacillus sp. HMF5848]|uniref:hotdog fold thioesterase n=1 Tax=Bacillus sp. HMF5848 TaxID=2495421 RepID=UPI000F7B3CCC|nr:hotdog fold thioesterase [Bacillus sp. HMF5848]RSK27146.1 hotdog fold thioesterase [Bacillus sp. HMF5848]